MEDLIKELQDKVSQKNKDMYKSQEKRLLAHFEDDNLVDVLSEHGCYVAGGAITSIFTNREVNDLDVYFRSVESLIAFVENMFGEMNKPKRVNGMFSRISTAELEPFSLIYRGHTNKSILCRTPSGQEVQLIHDRFYETPEDIFNNFDFHLNMGCYDIKEGVFVLSDHFLIDNSARVMTVNPNTAFPIISQLRIDKYKQRGYTINRKEFILLACAVSQLNFMSWSDVKDAVGGMYGYCIDDIFDETVEFSYTELFEQLIELESNDGRFVGLTTAYTCEELVKFIKVHHSLVVEEVTPIPPQATAPCVPTKGSY